MASGGKPSVYAIVTDRMVMRSAEPADTDGLYALAVKNGARLGEWDPAQFASRAAVLSWIRRCRAESDLGRQFTFTITLHGDSQPIGSSSLDPGLPQNGAEITGWFDVDQASKGYAFEGSAALVKIAFEHYGSQRVEMRCDPDNQPVHRLLDKLGFRHEATLRRRGTSRDGELRDRMIWVIHDVDYPGSPASGCALLGCDPLGDVVFATDPVPAPPADSPWARGAVTWQTVRDQLAHRYPLTDAGPTAISFTVRFSHRAATLEQEIDVSLASVLGEELVVVVAPVGPEAELAAREALVHSATLAMGALCLVGDEYHLRQSVALADLNARALDRIIMLVGHEAARLRARNRFGADDAEVYAWVADGQSGPR